MCKFTNRLFVFAILSLIYIQIFIEASPCSKKQKKKCDIQRDPLDYDHDVYIDQRQKGGENLRIKLDGFFIGAREPSSSDLIGLGDTLLGNLGEELIIGLNKNRSKIPEPINLLSYKGLSPRTNEQQEDLDEVKTIIVEKEADTKPQSEPILLEQPENGSQTKFRIYKLLNLLRNSRRA